MADIFDNLTPEQSQVQPQPLTFTDPNATQRTERISAAPETTPLDRAIEFVLPDVKGTADPKGIASAQITLEARRAGLSVRDFLNKSPQAKPIEKASREVDRFLSGIGQGAVGTIGSMLGAVDWLADSDTARKLSQRVQVWQREKAPTDPGFTDALASGLGSSVVFFIPGLGVAKGANVLANVTPRLASWIGASTAAVLESATEAGDVYNSVLSDGKSEKQASRAATVTFLANMPLIAVTNKIGVFSDSGAGIRRAVTSALVEGAQEMGQTVISAGAQGHPVDTRQVLTSGAVGAIIGGGMGAITGLPQGVEQRPDPQVEQQVEQQDIFSGLSPELAAPLPQELQDPTTQTLDIDLTAPPDAAAQLPGLAPETETIPEVTETAAEVQDIFTELVPETAPETAPAPLKTKPFAELRSLDELKESLETQKEFRPETQAPTDIQKHIKRVTGQTKIKSLVTGDERVFLRDFLKMQERISKKAAKAGAAEAKILAAEKALRQRQQFEKRLEQAQVRLENAKGNAKRVLENRVANLKNQIDRINQKHTELKLAERARAVLKKRMGALVKSIRRPAAQSLPLEYKQQIQDIQNQYDLTKRTSKTLRRRVNMQKFIDRMRAEGNTVNIPKATIDMLEKKTLNEMTIAELEFIDDMVQQLKHVGRLKSNLIKVQADRSLATVVGGMSAPMSKQRQPTGLPPSAKVTRATKKQFEKSTIRKEISKFFAMNLRVERILEKLDGFKKNGPNVGNIYNPINKATNRSFAAQQKIVDKFQKAGKKYNIDFHKLATEDRTMPSGNVFTGEEIMEVAIALFDQAKLRHLKAGNNLTDANIVEVIDNMPQNERDFVQWEMKNYWQPQYKRVNAVYERLYNNTLPSIEGYSSIRLDTDIAEFLSFDESIAKELLGRNELRSAFVERGFTKERARAAAQPLNLNHFDNFFNNLGRVEHFIAFGEIARDVRKIIKDPRYKRSVVDASGRDTYNIIDTWLDDVISQKSKFQDSPVTPMVRLLRHHTSVAMLGYNVLTSMKQLMSFPIAAAEIGVTPILSGAAQYIQHGKELEQFVYERSPQMKNRAVERDIQELLRQAKSSDILAKRQRLSVMSMSLIKAMDKYTVVSIWKGAYDQQMALDKTEQEAIEFADKVIRTTQPAYTMKDLPAFFRGGELEKIMTMFMNQRNQNWNYLSHDIFGAAKAGAITKPQAFRKLLWWLSPALMLGMVSRGRLDMDSEELLQDLAKYPLTGLFAIGSIVDTMISGWDWSVPVTQPVKEMILAVSSKRPATKMKHGAKALMMVSGLPTTVVFRTGGGAIDLLQGKTKDFRRLYLSEYALKKKRRR